MPKVYYPTGKWEDLANLFRCYNLEDVLTHIGIASIELLNDKSGRITCGAKSIEFPAKIDKTNETVSLSVLISAWDLIDVAYNAVKTTNDFRGDKIQSENAFWFLCCANKDYMQKEESNLIEIIKEQPEFWFYTWGFAGEQIKLQEISEIYEKASRELYILLSISREVGGIDVPEAIRKEIGVEWEEVLSSIMLAGLGLNQRISIDTIIKKVKWDNCFKKESFIKVIDRYTTDYSEIKSSPLLRQIFYTKPFVKTKKGSLISINSFLNLCLYEHCLLWVARDYYRKQNKQDFTSYFGELFEKYFEEILSFYLEQEQFVKIPVGKKKRADWKVNIMNYSFLIEQKSTLLALGAKQQNSNYTVIGKYVNTTIVKALKQLEETEQFYNDGQYIKIVLIYEDYLGMEILDTVFDMPGCTIKNDNMYWLVTISEMEMLLDIYRTDPKLFETIINEKIKREVEHSKLGKSIYQLLKENGITANSYLKQSKFTYYDELPRKIIEERL